MLRRLFALSLSSLACLLPAAAQTGNTPYLQQAFEGVNTLQTWYQPDTGLYQTTGWWNAGNSITVLANYSRLNNTQAYYPIFANTLKQAALVNPGFTDGYYDDAGWWALGWIDVYDVTKQPQYLQQAASIFEAMTGAWDNTCNGGVWWNTDRKYKNAITNELFLSVAAELAAREPTAAKSGGDTYLSWAQREWTWFHGSGMINPNNRINDGLDPATCKNNGQNVWSYNQGVVLGGLVQLSALTHDTTLIPQAQTIADTAIARMTDVNGVFHDTCEPSCGEDGVEFKGVFSRNLMALNAAAPDQRYKTFADVNAESIWNHARGPNYQLGQVWSGPFDAGNAGSQNSALDAILFAASAEAIAVGGGGPVPSFTLSAAPASLNLTAGTSGSATVALAPSNGFSGSVALTATVVGAPAGVQATLAAQTLTGTGQTTLSLTTTGRTPGGSFLVAVTGVSGNLAQTAYVTVQLPDFTLTSAAKILYLNQSGDVQDALTTASIDGFNSPVDFAAAALPSGVRATFSPQSATSGGTILNLLAGPNAATTPGTPITVSGTSGSTTHTLSNLQLAVSAALSNCGRGAVIDLKPFFNLTALRTDGSPFTDGGADGSGFVFSATLTGTSRVLNGTRFTLGPADAPNAIAANGQTITLPAGRFNTLRLMGTGVQGTQAAQPLTVTYTDGTTTTFTQSFHDWYGMPTLDANEGEAVAMPYRNQADGTRQAIPFNIYSYTLAVDPSKTVQTLTLPKNKSVLVLAGTLSTENFGRAVDLAGAYNLTGLYTDGTAIPSNGGVDGGGYGYSANLLGDTGSNGAEVTVGALRFHLGPTNHPDAVFTAGQSITLPLGPFQTLQLLGTAVGGNQLDQPITLHYADGSTETRTLSFSDWFSPGNFPNEIIAITNPYRDTSNGTPQNTAFNIYTYTLPLTPGKPVRSITLPSNRNVVLLGLTLNPWSQFVQTPTLCRAD